MKVKLDLYDFDGNAYGLLAAFRKEARRQGHSQEKIDVVVNEAKSGDYDHLLQTLIGHTE